MILMFFSPIIFMVYLLFFFGRCFVCYSLVLCHYSQSLLTFCLRSLVFGLFGYPFSSHTLIFSYIFLLTYFFFSFLFYCSRFSFLLFVFFLSSFVSPLSHSLSTLQLSSSPFSLVPLFLPPFLFPLFPSFPPPLHSIFYPSPIPFSLPLSTLFQHLKYKPQS